MRKIARYPLVVLVLCTFVWLTACERTLSGTEKTAVLAFSEATTDNLLLAGLTVNDYAAFSRDFDSDMSEEIPATDFAAWKQELDNQLGNYLSRQVDQVTQADEFYVVVYQAKFEQEEPVTVTVAFHASDHSIAFLSFDSEEFSWSTFQ
jgi:hypothetical protein